MAYIEFTDRPLRFGIITVSDTRTVETDKGGDRVESLALEGGFEVVERSIVKDEFDAIYRQVQEWGNRSDIDVIVTTGGTGIAKRDVTIEAVQALIEKEIPGFGEIFRYLSYTEDIGTKAIASRAISGVYNNHVIFSIPGSVGAVTLGMTKLIVPEVKHLVREILK